MVTGRGGPPLDDYGPPLDYGGPVDYDEYGPLEPLDWNLPGMMPMLEDDWMEFADTADDG